SGEAVLREAKTSIGRRHRRGCLLPVENPRPPSGNPWPARTSLEQGVARKRLLRVEPSEQEAVLFRQEVAVLARAGAAAAAATACSSLQKLSSTGQLKVHAAADRARHRGGQTLTSPAPDRSADLAADRQAAVSRPHIRGASHRLRRSG